MRNIFLVVALSFTGCLIPLGLGDAGPDAGMGGGLGGGTGGGGSACTPQDGGIDWSALPCTLVAPAPLPEGPFTLLLPGCRQQQVQVVGMAGNRVPFEVTSDAIGTRLTAASWPAGVYQVLVGNQPMQVEIYELQNLNAGTVRTYVEPVDDCVMAALTDQGRLVCQRMNQVTVYELDGSVHARFTGERAAVAGDEIWSLGGGGIERRIDQPSGLALEGAMADSRLEADAPFGETVPGRSIRGGLDVVVEFTWANGTMTSRSWPLSLAWMFLFREGETIWNERACTVFPTMTCPLQTAGVLALSPTRAWLNVVAGDGSFQLAEMMRPVRAGQLTLRRAVPLGPGGVISGAASGRPVFLTLSNPPAVVLVGVADGLTHFRVMQEAVVANTQKYVLSRVSPSSLRITPN